MRVVQINTFPYKATGTIMMNLHKTMLEQGVDSYVVWGRGRQPENEHEITIEDKWGMRFHGAYTRLTDRTGFASSRATDRLLEELERIKPDIVHLHNIHGYYLHIGKLLEYLKKKKIQVVYTLHDCWSFTGHCAYFDMIGCNKWKTGCFSCPQKKTYPASYVLDASNWNYQKKKHLFQGMKMIIVTPCQWLADKVQESYLQQYPVKVIYNGVDFQTFSEKEHAGRIREKYQIQDKCLILGVASEWTERKGLQDFIKLNAMLDPDNYQIMMVGLKKEQISMLQSSDENRNIIAMERTADAEELAAIYSAADVFFNPTYEDNFPTTNLEAIACKTPVCTYRTGGSVESVSEDVGIVVEKGDIKAFYDWISERVTKGYTRKMGIQIDRQQMMKCFGKEQMINRYQELYKELYAGD